MTHGSMNMSWIELVLVALCLLGCRGSPEGSRPSWIKRGANIEHPDYLFVVGTCTGRSGADDARQCALEDARRQLREVLNVRGGLVREEHAESHMGTITRGSQTIITMVHDAWVLMAYPRKMLQGS